MPEVRRRHHRNSDQVPGFLRQYRFEIIWLAVVALGLFLVFERMNIRVSLGQRLRSLMTAVLESIGRFDEVLADFLARTTASDAIGYLLILGALVALVLRLRWRLMHNPRLTVLQCPKCDGDIHRVHRTSGDHLIGAFVPVRRYRCTNRECNWRGLRVGTPKTVASVKPTVSRG